MNRSESLKTLQELRQKLAAGIDRYDGDMSRATDDPELVRLSERADGLQDLLNRDQRRSAVAEVNRTVVDGTDGVEVSRPSLERTVGEYFHGQSRALLGRLGNPRFVGDADEFGRVVAHGVAADGTAPVTIEGSLVKFVDANRYAVNASRRLPLPDNRAPTFKRPRVTQTTSVGTQATEGDVLSSQRLQLTGDTITKVTKGGVLSLSEQEIDWSDPSMLGQAVVSLAESYAIDSDDFHCSAIETAFTASTQTVLSNTATLAEFVAGVAASANACYGTAKKVPDTLFVAPDRWAYIIALTDTTGRPAFPFSGPQNVPGAGGGVNTFSGGLNVLGLRVVADPNFTAGVWGTAVSQLVEFAEQDKGIVQLNAVSTLEVALSYRGYIASYVPQQAVNSLEPS